MPMLSKTVVDADLRTRIFDDVLCLKDEGESYEFNYFKVNDRQYGVIITDKNGHERYCRLGVIVAEEREDMTARQLMAAEIADYQARQAKKAEKAAANAEKAKKDKAKREEAKKKKEEEEDDPNQYLPREVRE